MAIDDSAVVAAVQAGNLAEFSRLVEKYTNYVFSICFGVLQDTHIAQDVTQEAFLKAYTSIQRFEQDSFKSWLARIATNASIDHLRKRQRDSLRVQHLEDETDRESQIQPSAEVEAMQQLRQQQLRKLVASLPEHYRVVVDRYYFQEQGYRQIAQELGISEKTVESQLYRARKLIKTRWKEE